MINKNSMACRTATARDSNVTDYIAESYLFICLK